MADINIPADQVKPGKPIRGKVQLSKDENGNIIGVIMEDGKILVSGSLSVPTPYQIYYIQPSRWVRLKLRIKHLLGRL